MVSVPHIHVFRLGIHFICIPIDICTIHLYLKEELPFAIYVDGNAHCLAFTIYNTNTSMLLKGIAIFHSYSKTLFYISLAMLSRFQDTSYPK